MRPPRRAARSRPPARPAAALPEQTSTPCSPSARADRRLERDPVAVAELGSGLVEDGRPAVRLEDHRRRADLAGDRHALQRDALLGDQLARRAAGAAGQEGDERRRHAERARGSGDVQALAAGRDLDVGEPQHLAGPQLRDVDVRSIVRFGPAISTAASAGAAGSVPSRTAGPGLLDLALVSRVIRTLLVGREPAAGTCPRRPSAGRRWSARRPCRPGVCAKPSRRGVPPGAREPDGVDLAASVGRDVLGGDRELDLAVVAADQAHQAGRLELPVPCRTMSLPAAPRRAVAVGVGVAAAAGGGRPRCRRRRASRRTRSGPATSSTRTPIRIAPPSLDERGDRRGAGAAPRARARRRAAASSRSGRGRAAGARRRPRRPARRAPPRRRARAGARPRRGPAARRRCGRPRARVRSASASGCWPEQPVGDPAGVDAGAGLAGEGAQPGVGARAHVALRDPEQLGELAVGATLAEDQLQHGALVGGERVERGHAAKRG